MPTGTITGVFGAYFHLRSKDDNRFYLAKPGGRLRLKGARENRGHLLAIGLSVEFEPLVHTGAGEMNAIITDVHPPVNLVRRASVDRIQTLGANLESVAIISTFAEPGFNSGFIDRVLVEAEDNSIPFYLIVNKYDLLDEIPDNDKSSMEEKISVYESLGYTVFRESFRQRVSPELRNLFANKRTLLLGQSGVGKSTLLNLLSGRAVMQTQEIGYASKGRHTTTNPVLLEAENNAWIIDMPGVREFGLLHCSESCLRAGFREFKDLECRFDNCTHTHEPGCAVREAVEEGRIARFRYESYLSIRESLAEKYKPRRGDYRNL